jgi:N-methylhydantoinase B
MTLLRVQQVVRREVLRGNLRAVVEDMSAALEHNSPSEAISDGRDYAIALTDARGEVVVVENEFHLPSLALTAQAVLDYYEFDLKAGDIVVTNDPFLGGTHALHLTMFVPVHRTGERVACLLVRVRVPDLGGQAVGGLNPAAQEIWAEGVRITPVKLARSGHIDKDVLHTIALNSRLPEQLRGLMDAALASLTLGETLIQKLIGQYGLEVLIEGLQYTLDYSEAAVRKAIRDWQPGVYFAEEKLGADPNSGGSAIVRCKIEASAARLRIDFAGSSAQQRSFMNSSWGATSGSALLPVLGLLGEDVPVNSGVLRVIELAGEDGTIVRPTHPAPVGWGAMHPGSEIIAAVASALQKCTGKIRVLSPTHVMVHCLFANYRVFALDSLVQPGASALDRSGGWGPPGHLARRRLPSIEKCEIAFPEIFLKRLELVADASQDGHCDAPGSEVQVALRSEAHVTACVVGTANESASPLLSFGSQVDGEQPCVVSTCIADRRDGGTLTLRTASGRSSAELPVCTVM